MSTLHDPGAAPMQLDPRDPDIHAGFALPRDDDVDCCEVCAIPATRE